MSETKESYSASTTSVTFPRFLLTAILSFAVLPVVFLLTTVVFVLYVTRVFWLWCEDSAQRILHRSSRSSFGY